MYITRSKLCLLCITEVMAVKIFKFFNRAVSVITAGCIAACAFAAVSFSAGAAVTIDDGDFRYSYSNGAWQLFEYIGEGGAVTLPQSFNGLPVNEICERCFVYSDVTSVTVPEGYVKIGNNAFSGCAELKEVSLPSSVSSLGMYAFAQSGIESADLSALGIDRVSAYLFSGCGSLETVLLPDGIETIGTGAFLDSGITQIDVPDGVITIGKDAFSGTSALESVTLPSTLVSLGNGCFEYSAVSNIELPESLETIGTDAFRNATTLESLYIPESVTSIGANALFPMSVQSTIEVTCFSNTYAETYCYENFVMNYNAIEKVMGDVNLDGVVTIDDATEVQRYIAMLGSISQPGRVVADVNYNGIIEINDATQIQRFLARYIEYL